MPRGKEQIQVPSVKAGDIGVVAKLSVTSTGDTLCDRGTPLLVASHRLSRAALFGGRVPQDQGRPGQDG